MTQANNASVTRLVTPVWLSSRWKTQCFQLQGLLRVCGVGCQRGGAALSESCRSLAQRCRQRCRFACPPELPPTRPFCGLGIGWESRARLRRASAGFGGAWLMEQVPTARTADLRRGPQPIPRWSWLLVDNSFIMAVTTE